MLSKQARGLHVPAIPDKTTHAFNTYLMYKDDGHENPVGLAGFFHSDKAAVALKGETNDKQQPFCK
jgi:hypothetical protein